MANSANNKGRRARHSGGDPPTKDEVSDGDRLSSTFVKPESERPAARQPARKRLLVELSEAQAARIEALKAILDAPSDADVVRRALRVFDYLVQQGKDHWEIVLCKGDSEMVLPFPLL